MIFSYECEDLGVIIHSKENELIIIDENEYTEISSEKDDKLKNAFFFLACLAAPRLKILALERKLVKFKHTPANLRKKIKEQHDLSCCICGERFNPEKLSIHHIRALSAGGQSLETNLVPLCIKDHSRLHEFMACLENWYVNELKKRFLLNRQLLVLKSIHIARMYLDNFFNKKNFKSIFKHDEKGVLN